ncbi:MAG: hypothetical protein ACE5FI_14890 [Anaerolineales bacterium]
MTNTAISRQLGEQIAQLPLGLQRKVLDFAQALVVSSPKGIPGKQLLRFAGTMDHDDIRAIEQAIEAECEKVEENEW